MMIKSWLRDWLGVEKPKNYSKLLDEEVKEIRKQLMADVATEIRHWTQTVGRIGEIECSVCGKKIVTYPFGGGYYRGADGSVICSNKCLNKKPAPKESE